MSKPWKDIPRKGKEVKLDDESEIGERREFLLKLAKDLGVSKQIALETLFEEIAYETQPSNIEFENPDIVRLHAFDFDRVEFGPSETQAAKGWFWKWNPFS